MVYVQKMKSGNLGNLIFSEAVEGNARSPCHTVTLMRTDEKYDDFDIK